MFKYSNKNKIPLTIKNRSIQRKKAEKLLSPQKEIKCQLLLNKHVRKLQKKLKTKGIEYEIQVCNVIFKKHKTFKVVNNFFQTFNSKPSTNKVSRSILEDKCDDNLSNNHTKHSVTMIVSDNEEEIPIKIITKLTKKKNKKSLK